MSSSGIEDDGCSYGGNFHVGRSPSFPKTSVGRVIASKFRVSTIFCSEIIEHNGARSCPSESARRTTMLAGTIIHFCLGLSKPGTRRTDTITLSSETPGKVISVMMLGILNRAESSLNRNSVVGCKSHMKIDCLIVILYIS